MQDQNQFPRENQVFMGRKKALVIVSAIGFCMLGSAHAAAQQGDVEEYKVNENIDNASDIYSGDVIAGEVKTLGTATTTATPCCNNYTYCCNTYTKGIPSGNIPGCCNTYTNCVQDPPEK